MNISIIGAGYVGLVSGACLAEIGHNVSLFTRSQDKVSEYEAGRAHIYEPGLNEMMLENLQRGRLSFTADFAGAVAFGQAVFICVGTPPREDGSADLSAVFETASRIGQVMNDQKLVVVKSTVPVGTTHEVGRLVRKELSAAEKPEQWCLIANNPEFLREGSAVRDFLKPDRVVAGVESLQAREMMLAIYEPIADKGCPVLTMRIKSSEMAKYAANSMLATKISFINEMANICEQVDADIAEVREGMCHDSRIGFNFLEPGVGYGGSCFPKDVKAVISLAAQHGYPSLLLRAVDDVNHRQRELLAEKFLRRLGENREGMDGAILAMWGLAFKPHTDDVREAPSLVIINQLARRGVKVHAHDPQAGANALKYLDDPSAIILFDDPYQALEGAGALAVVTQWPDYENPDFARIKSLLRQPLIFDGRNMYSGPELAALGFVYESIGRRAMDPD